MDSAGCVGIFPSRAAASAALKPYVDVPFVSAEWPCASEDPDVAWALPFRKSGVLASVSDDIKVVGLAQNTLARLDLVGADDLDFYKVKVGVVFADAKCRLDAATASTSLSERREDPEKTFDELLVAGRGSPSPDVRLNILKNVVYSPLG